MIKVTKKDWLRIIFHHLNRLCGLPPASRVFPGVMPRPLTRNDLPRVLCSRGGCTKYVLTPKTDGTRMLFLAFTHREKPYCFLLSRSLDVYAVPLCARSYLFKGTVLDGEKVDCEPAGGAAEPGYGFVIFDSFAINGIPCYQGCDYITRMNLAYRAIQTTQHTDPKAIPYLSVKPFFDLPGLPQLLQRDWPWKVDGLLFVPVAGGEILKWKPHHTADFQIRIDGPETTSRPNVRLLASERKQQDFVLIDWDTAHWTAQDLELHQVTEAAIVECIWTPTEEGQSPATRSPSTHTLLRNCAGSWQPYRLRADKRFPNVRETVQSCEAQVLHSLTLEELTTRWNWAVRKRKQL